jgi:L-seryl-tRNA(Ser) seleniumtransferase
MDPRDLPSVDALAARLAGALARPLPGAIVTAVARDAVEEARTTVLAGGTADPFTDGLIRLQRLAAHRPGRVINATGVLLHTNLGRAPLAPSAWAEAAHAATGYTNVELDLASGARGGRGGYVHELLCSLTGAEAALAVNNNAGGLLLALAAIAGRDGRVLVSRGELIEIGGSFRLPDVMAASGATLVEVGTTNRTRVGDYAARMDGAALVLKVHPSNYRIEGFAEEPGYGELAALARRAGVPFAADVGSGLLDTRVPWLEGPPPAWLADEPGVRQTLEAGADVVLFSGDKLLGGPQAGLAVGTATAIEAMARHPLARALRVDGVTQAMLAATLEAYAGGTAARLPFWAMATIPYEVLEERHRRLLAQAGVAGRVVAAESLPGAGSVPGRSIPSPAITLDGRGDASWKALVDSDPPIVARRRDDKLVLDLRTVDPADDAVVAATLARLG